MKMINRFLLAATLLSSHSVIANSTLDIPDGVTLYVLNGKAYEQDNFLFGTHEDVKLQEGENQIVFKFKTSVKQGTDDIRTYDSDTIIAKFNISSTNAIMVMPNYWSVADAQEGIKKLSWQLKTDSGKQISVKEDILPSNGIQFARDYERETRKYNNHDGIAAMTVSMADSVQTLNSKPNNNNAASPTLSNQAQQSPEMQTTTSEMLKYWYNKADINTKKEFEEYLDSQK